jgi:hypothetical protein
MCIIETAVIIAPTDLLELSWSGFIYGICRPRMLAEEQVQYKTTTEMVRAVIPGRLVGVGEHDQEHYWEAIDACFRCVIAEC